MTQLNVSPTAERWNIGILGALVLIVVWGFAFLGLVQKHEQSVSETEYHIDIEQNLSIADVLRFSDEQWSDTGQDDSLGMASEPFWFRFEIPAAPDALDERIIEVDYPLLDSLELWLMVEQAGQLTPLTSYQLGDAKPFESRPIKHPLFLIPIPTSAEPIIVFARVQTSGTVRFPVSVWEHADYLEYSANHSTILALFFGFMLAMAISNLFFFITTRSWSFLVYTGYVVSLGITLAALHGLAFQYFWPNWIWIQGRAILIFASLTLVFAVIFSYQTLDIPRYSQKLARFLAIIAGIFGLFTLLSLIAPYSLMIKLLMIMVLLAVASILVCGVWLSVRGNQLAKYYTVAWSFLLLSGASAILDNLDLLPLPISSHYILIFGASVETLLLGLILAMSYSQQRDSLSLAQEQALMQEQAAAAAKDELIELQQKSQEELEYNVEERTLELQIALRELSEANRELEQLSALDQLTNIHNRRHFDKRLLAESRRSRREQTSLAIAMIDIDHFKQVNDQYGHIGGDRCLQIVSKALAETLKRPSDEVCRYGGEEFAFILPNTELSGAQQLMEEVRSVVSKLEVESDEHRFSVSISVGVTATVIEYEGAEKELLKAADKLLYEAKQNGRNCVVARPFNQE